MNNEDCQTKICVLIYSYQFSFFLAGNESGDDNQVKRDLLIYAQTSAGSCILYICRAGTFLNNIKVVELYVVALIIISKQFIKKCTTFCGI